MGDHGPERAPAGAAATAGRTLGPWLDDLASDASTPGGGPAAAVVGAMGAALIAMVGRLTAGRERFADVDRRMREIVEVADGERHRLVELADRDAEVFELYMSALRLPKGSEDERDARSAALGDAAVAAADVPLEVARRSVDLMELAVEVAATGNPHAASDGACGSTSPPWLPPTGGRRTSPRSTSSRGERGPL